MCLRDCRIIPAVVLLILAVVGMLLVVFPTKELEMPPEYMYGIILDAGSSHTSMYIYKWPADKQNGTGIVTQHSECQVKGGGISSYTGDAGGAAKSLEDCLNQAVTVIPKSRQHETPLHLGATAGMRLLKEVNATQSDRVLKEVEKKLRSYPFMFKEATILTGQQEGAYGWVTVNYLLENFAKYGFVGRWLNPGRDTIGALDLGGASTQITFETLENVENNSTLMNLKLYGKTYKLYTQSFLCYGQDQFLRKLLAHLVKTQAVKTSISHPCYPKQFNMSIKLGKDVFDSPCTKDDRPAHFHPETSVTLVGTGNYQNCLGNVRNIFSFNSCSYSKCSFNGVYQPGVRGRFMMTKKTNKSEKYMKNVCAIANYIQVLLTEGYHFDSLSFPSISFEKKAGGASVGWALGYMLSLSNMVPTESPGLMKALPLGPWAGILFLFVALLCIALGYLLMIYRSTTTKEGMV